MYTNSIFWFRQDLRTFDNLWLIKAIKQSKNLLCIFILDKNIIDDFWWLEDKKFSFLKESLINLDKQLKKIGWYLRIFYDKPENIIKDLCEKYSIEAIFTNKSYSKYWKNRDLEIENFALKNEIEFFSEKDFLLIEPEEVEPRKVFTPFFKLWQKKIKDYSLQIPENIKNIILDSDYENTEIFLNKIISWEKHPYFSLQFWKTKLEHFDFVHYENFRNFLDKDWTSRLSVYIRFGIFSIREVYLKAKDKSQSFVSELAWREFWQHIDYHFPFSKNLEFQERKRNIKWENNEFLFERFCEWKTGYPVVDASIKQLLETNRMHWRARMIVASFLTKDLHIDWRMWEKFFKKYLLDYDENVNIWNWQWSASVWADPKPLRIFNPNLQSEKFDKNAKFIKKYVKELENVSEKEIHNPTCYKLNYFAPIVDHNIEQKKTREMYKSSPI